MMKIKNLTQMKTGEKGRIVKIEGGSSLEKRLSSLGIGLGKHVLKMSAFVLRGPVAVRVGRTVIALGHGMAIKVFVEQENK